MTRRGLLRFAALAAAPAQKLAVVRPSLHQREEGPLIPSGYEYIGGEIIYFSMRISGFAVQKDKMDVRYQLVLTDPQGLLVTPPIAGGVQAEVYDNDKDWLPKATESIPLPPQLPPGTYQLKIRVADEFAKTSAEETIPLRVRGAALPTVDSFSILNLAFYRTEQDRLPIQPPSYRAGDSIWARFQMAGFQLGEKNRFDVEYGLAIFRPSGKQLYAEPKAASEQDQPFYPKRLLYGALSLNLSSDLSPGEYRLVITARDNVGQQTAEVTATVQVTVR